MSVFKRITVVFISVLAFFTILIFIFSSRSISSHYINTITSYLESDAILIRNLLKPMMENPDIEEIDSIVDRIAQGLNVRITVVDVSGKVLGDSLKDPRDMENHGNRIEIKDALNKGLGKSIRYSTTVDRKMLYVALPIKDGEKNLGVVRTSLFLKDVETIVSEVRKKLFLYFLFTLLVAFLMLSFLTRTITKPINELNRASKEMAKHNFEVSLPETSILEIKELIKNFQIMASKVRELINEINAERDGLKTIIENIKEGIVVTDKNGRIVILNPSFKTITSSDILTGRFFWEVLRSVEAKELFEEIKKSQKSEAKELKIGNNFFIVSCGRLPEGFVFVFTDITPLKQIERTKRELISNISHELKTPLTAIKGFVETLEDVVKDEDAQSFIRIMKRQTERMIKILKDILTLSKFEDSAFQLNIEKVNLKELAERTLKLFEKRMKEKGLTAEFSCEENITINADPELMEQMLINLIDNAINYTEKGRIGVSIKIFNSKVKVEVFDTGIGIPEEHIPRIFERFYVVEKSRAKETGGTGLGLSIVKHIVLLHNGDIKVESKVGEGTRFIITLPL